MPRAEAGRSADAVYRRGLAGWRRRIGWKLLVVAAGAGLVAVAVSFLPHGQFLAGAVVGAAFALVAAAWDEPPRVVERWRLGRDGERRTERALRPLAASGWQLRHDLDDRYGNIDHVAVGPGGVYLLDSKHLAGTFSIEDGVLHCRHADIPESDYTLPNLGRQTSAAAFALRERLERQLGWIVDVRPVVVLWAEFPEERGKLGGVTVVAGAQLADWLASQPRRLAEVDEPAVVSALAAVPAAA